MQLCDGDLKVF